MIGLMFIESLHLNYRKADKNYFCSTKIGRNMLYIIYTPVYKYSGTCIHTLTFCTSVQHASTGISKGDWYDIPHFFHQNFLYNYTLDLKKKVNLTIRNLLYWFSIFFRNYFYAVSYFQTTKQPNLLEDVLVLYKSTF